MQTLKIKKILAKSKSITKISNLQRLNPKKRNK